MADITIFSDKISDNADILEALQLGSYYMSLMYNMNEAQSNVTYTEKERLYDFWKLEQETFRGPLPIKIKAYDADIVDLYNLDSDIPIIMSDIIVGVGVIALPTFTFKKNLLVDVLTAGAFYGIKEDLGMSYAVMQVAFFLISKYGYNIIQESEYNGINLKTGVLNA